MNNDSTGSSERVIDDNMGLVSMYLQRKGRLNLELTFCRIVFYHKTASGRRTMTKALLETLCVDKRTGS